MDANVKKSSLAWWCVCTVFVGCSDTQPVAVDAAVGRDVFTKQDVRDDLAITDVVVPTDVVAMRRLPEVLGVAEAVDTNTDARIVEVSLTAAPSTVQWLMGRDTPTLAYNGTVPGPMIHARVGDTVRVHFRNEMEEETTVHWHGLRISDQMDGSPAIQEPVRPGGTFTYEFVVPDAGTFWYHAHVSTEWQIDRGLYGAIVVHEEQPPTVDRERLFVLDDIRLTSTGQIGPRMTSGPDVGRGRLGNILLANGRPLPLAMTAPRNSVERWRILNAANARSLTVRIDGAVWQVVGTDGGLLPRPYTADEIVIAPGQRYELEVRMQGDGTDAKLITAVPVLVGMAVENRDYEVATVTYDGEVETRPEWVAPNVMLPSVTPPTPMTRSWNLSGRATDAGVEFSVNGMVGTGHGSHTTSVTEFDRFIQGTPIRITLQSNVSPEHPFHLHGQFFQIVAPRARALAEPGLKDTVLVRGAEAVTILTWFENPGQWMFHCHIAEHAERGMLGHLTIIPRGM
jgi:FtsP/CotA-like multicopper oxidase with cupredoxin domain